MSHECPTRIQVEKMLISPPINPFQKYKSSIKKAVAFLDKLDNVSNVFERVNIVETQCEEFILCLSLLFLDPVVELAYNRVRTLYTINIGYINTTFLVYVYLLTLLLFLFCAKHFFSCLDDFPPQRGIRCNWLLQRGFHD